MEVTGTIFASRVDDPVHQQVADPEHVRLVNVDGPTRTIGTELLFRYRAGMFTAWVTHGWTRSTEIDPDHGDRREVPLTPRQSASFTARARKAHPRHSPPNPLGGFRTSWTPPFVTISFPAPLSWWAGRPA